GELADAHWNRRPSLAVNDLRSSGRTANTGVAKTSGTDQALDLADRIGEVSGSVFGAGEPRKQRRTPDAADHWQTGVLCSRGSDQPAFQGRDSSLDWQTGRASGISGDTVRGLVMWFRRFWIVLDGASEALGRGIADVFASRGRARG